MKSVLVSSMCFGISVSRYLKYWYILSSLALAVSTKLYTIALALAPLIVSISFQLFLPTQKALLLAQQYYYPKALLDHQGILVSISLDSSNTLFPLMSTLLWFTVYKIIIKMVIITEIIKKC